MVIFVNYNVKLSEAMKYRETTDNACDSFSHLPLRSMCTVRINISYLYMCIVCFNNFEQKTIACKKIDCFKGTLANLTLSTSMA